MTTALQIALILILIALIGIILGYLFGKLSCKKLDNSTIIEGSNICEDSYKQNLIDAQNSASSEEDTAKSVTFNEKNNNTDTADINNNTKNISATKPQFLTKPRDGKADNLCRIKGIGTVLEAKLHELGVYHFDQIAIWTQEEIAWVDKHLAFSGRIVREKWVEQAKLLADGQETEFSQRVDKGEVETSKKS